MVRTKKFPNGIYAFYREYDTPMDAYDDWKRLKRSDITILARISPTGWKNTKEKPIIWVRKARDEDIEHQKKLLDERDRMMEGRRSSTGKPYVPWREQERLARLDLEMRRKRR